MITLWTCIHQVLLSNLGRDTGSTEFFPGFPYSFYASTRTVPRLCKEHFLPNPFQYIIHQSPITLPFDAM
jgi:hypothetical protein